MIVDASLVEIETRILNGNMKILKYSYKLEDLRLSIFDIPRIPPRKGQWIEIE